MQRFSLQLQFIVFPTLHVPGRIDRKEFLGIAIMKPRLPLAAPGCLLGGALGGLSAAAPGYHRPP